MAVQLLQIKMDDYEADGGSVIGRVMNVYTSYANALTHGEDGLATIYAMTVLTGAQGAAITQVAKTTGVEVDNNGLCSFYVDDSEGDIYLMTVMGRNPGPFRVVVQ